MAKRVPVDEKPYRPVDEALVQSVLNPLLARDGLANGGEPRPEPETIGGGRDHDGSIAAPESPSALTRPTAIEPSPEPVAVAPLVPAGEKLSREKRVLLSRSEEREVERLIADMADKLCTPLKLSHVLRATVLLLRQAREEILSESQRVGPFKRPHNGEAEALVAFEHDLAQIIDRSLRNTAPLE